MVETRNRWISGVVSTRGVSSNGAVAVRRFVREDIPRVADLHRRVFGIPDTRGDRTEQGLSSRLLDAYERYFDEVFLNGPWQDDRIGSLVYEEGDGRIVGFLGVVARQMLWNDAPVQMALCSQFAVDPQRRGIVGLRLLAEHFKGPQDLSVTDEANEGTRRVWEARGGSTCPCYCIHWTRPLRPTRFVLSVMGKRKRLRAVARGCTPVARLVDAVATGWHKSPLHPPANRLAGDELDESTLLAALPEFAESRSLWPQYDGRSWKWTLKRAAQGVHGADFHKIALRDSDRRLAGWYIYHVDSTGMGDVLQIAARARFVNDVFNHLLRHAWQQGTVALSGRMDPPFFKGLADRYCLFRFQGSSTLVHARRPELLQPLFRGDAFFSRLEGEWCLRFRPG